MSVELPPSVLVYPQNPTPTDEVRTRDQENRPGRLVTALVLASGMIAAHEIDVPNAYANVVPIVVEMPFEGRWAYSNETTAACGPSSAQTSHPSCHENYSGDWGTDLYGGAGTEVKLRISSITPLTFSWDTTASGTCGETRRINVSSNGTSIGKLHVTHLHDAASFETAPTNGMVLGKIANLACNPGGSGKHVHMELKNTAANTYSCYTNHSNESAAAGILLAEGTSLGQLGSNNTATKQACAAQLTPPVAPTLDPTPAILQRTSGETNFVVVAPDKTLDYYFNPGGGGVWNRLDIPNADAKSTPATILRPDGELNIAAQGDDGSLDFHYNPPGTNTWGKIEIAGPGSAHSAPSIIQRTSGETNIVVQGPNNTLDFYFNAQGNPQWHKITVPGGQAYSKPAIVQRPNGETNIAVLGQNNSMDFYWNMPESPTWGKVPVAVGGTAMGAPSMIQRPTTGETIIAVQGPSHTLDLYLNNAGSPLFGHLRAASENSTFNDTNPPAMLLRPDGELNIAVHGTGNTASVYYNTQGQQQWEQTMAAAPGYAFKEPVMIQRATGETDLLIVGPNKRLDYYMNNQGSGQWDVLPISGNNSAY